MERDRPLGGASEEAGRGASLDERDEHEAAPGGLHNLAADDFVGAIVSPF